MENGKLNCWEYQGCGRGPGGPRSREGARCPASACEALAGVHEGVAAGRACWVIEGTYCDGSSAGPYEIKIHVCRKCAFYARVQVEEAFTLVSDEDLVRRTCVE
ncbi:MAG: hypothetical protein KGZ40_01355 [Clostridiales bacterium]|nr:hypothetical protein [Clostridiales bacterium]